MESWQGEDIPAEEGRSKLSRDEDVQKVFRQNHPPTRSRVIYKRPVPVTSWFGGNSVIESVGRWTALLPLVNSLPHE